MKGIRLNILLVCVLAICIAGCDGGKQQKQADVVSANTTTTIRNDELYPFMLAGIYFVHGYGGPEAAFNRLIKPAVMGEPGTDTFATSLQNAYVRYFVFPFKPQDDKDGKSAKATLADYWNIHNTAELERSLTWLLEEGHQAQYAQFRKVLEENGGAGFDIATIDLAKYQLSKKDLPGLEYIRDHYTEFSNGGVKAWDIARYINNICVAYQAGYLNRGEATVWLKKAPPVVQAQYSDWKSYFNDFLLGRGFWGGSESDNDRFRQEVAGMLEGKYSIYTYMPMK